MQDDITRVEEPVVDNTDYIAAIKELKQNSVSKAKYDSLEAERDKLREALITGLEEQPEEEEEQLESSQYYNEKLAKGVFKDDIDAAQTVVNFRKATIKEYGRDPYVTGSYGKTPEGDRLEPTYGEAETINEQFEILEEIIKEANGDNLYFNQLLQSAKQK